MAIRDGGVLATGFDAELDELRGLAADGGDFLLQLETRERERTGISNLRVEFNRVHGFYIEVTKGQTAKVPEDYRRRQTLKNAERYITPELKTWEDKVLSAQDRSLAREKWLFEQLLDVLAEHVRPLSDCAAALAELDTLAALAARRHDWVAPELSEQADIDIDAGRHPVVENAIERFTPNGCRLDPARRMLLITGPNMGGKSTYMRQVALIALLARTGSFVPAASARVGKIDRIFTRIGAADDLAGGRSTFMMEMTEAAAILSASTPNSLVLMDEIGRGTSTYDGLALAWAIACRLLAHNRALTLFATHYFELTRLPSEQPSAANVHLAAAESAGGIVFLHEVREGPASRSYGIQVAQRAGVPAAVIRQATRELERLESQGAPTPQLGLFAAAADADAQAEAAAERSGAFEALDALRDELAAIDPDSLTRAKRWTPSTVSRSICNEPRSSPAAAGQPEPQRLHAPLLAEEAPADPPGDSRLQAARRHRRDQEAGAPRRRGIAPDLARERRMADGERPLRPPAQGQRGRLDAAGAERGPAQRRRGRTDAAVPLHPRCAPGRRDDQHRQPRRRRRSALRQL